MAAPLFEQSEVEAIVGFGKYLSLETSRLRSREKVVDGVQVRKVQLLLIDTAPWPLEVIWETRRAGERSEITFALLAEVERRGREMMCRYDIHASAHENPPEWSDGRFFRPYEAHKHVYRPENLQHGDLTGLRVAAPLRIRGSSDFDKRCDTMFRIFCGDLNITVEKDPQMRLWS